MIRTGLNRLALNRLWGNSSAHGIGWDLVWPFQSGINPTFGSGDTPTFLRSTSKAFQTTEHLGAVAGSNETEVVNFFNGIDIGYGLLLEGNITNIFADENWNPHDCDMGTELAVASPYDLQPTDYCFNVKATASGGNISQGSADTVSDETCYFAFAARTPDGVANQTMQVSMKVSSEVYTQDFEITPEWTFFYMEKEFGTHVDAHLGVYIYPIKDYQADKTIYIAPIYMANIDTGGLLASAQASGGSSAYESISLASPDNFSGAEMSGYLEIYSLFKPGDGKNHYLFKISPIKSGDAGSRIEIAKLSNNKVNFNINVGGNQTVTANVNDTNFARLSWHKLAWSFASNHRRIALNGAALIDNSDSITVGDASLPEGDIKLASSPATSPANAIYRNFKLRKIPLSMSQLEFLTK